MAKNSIRDYDATAANNTDVQSTDISEGCAASGINNAIREVMADLKDVSTGTVALETPAVDQLNFGDNAKAIFGAGSDLQVFHDGTHSYVQDAGTGSLRILAENFAVMNAAETENMILAVPDAAVTLMYNGNTKLQTTPSGVDITGRITTDGITEDTSGNLLVGTTSKTNGDTRAAFHTTTNGCIETDRNSTTAYYPMLFYKNTSLVGSIYASGSSVAYNTSSDYRLKENVADMTGAIDRVKALAPKRFNFIADADTTVDGFMAHEAQTVVPEAVTGTHNEVDSDGNPVYQGIDQSKLVPLLTGALQEAIAKIETLETQRADLEARLTALENA